MADDVGGDDQRDAKNPSSKNDDGAEKAQAKWTQEKDEILINNYRNFESLGTRSCFELLAALIPGTTAKGCHHRGKQLQLKKLSAEEAMKLSRSLISEETH